MAVAAAAVAFLLELNSHVRSLSVGSRIEGEISAELNIAWVGPSSRDAPIGLLGNTSF